jgi:hypothetical protein
MKIWWNPFGQLIYANKTEIIFHRLAKFISKILEIIPQNQCYRPIIFHLMHTMSSFSIIHWVACGFRWLQPDFFFVVVVLSVLGFELRTSCLQSTAWLLHGRVLIFPSPPKFLQWKMQLASVRF